MNKQYVLYEAEKDIEKLVSTKLRELDEEEVKIGFFNPDITQFDYNKHIETNKMTKIENNIKANITEGVVE
jgi:hypothetical protein